MRNYVLDGSALLSNLDIQEEKSLTKHYLSWIKTN